MEPPSEPFGTSRTAPFVVIAIFGNQREQRCRTHPSGASGINCEDVPRPAQFTIRTPEVIVHCRLFKLGSLNI
eukprot:15476249-Alexandrium_andersonii.AAC.1